jgi:hypothetical protein
LECFSKIFAECTVQGAIFSDKIVSDESARIFQIQANPKRGDVDHPDRFIVCPFLPLERSIPPLQVSRIS